jgi:hypothetical protein
MTHAHRWLDHAATLRIGSMAALLSLLVLSVFVVPFTIAPTGALARIAQDVLLSLILLSGVVAISDHRAQLVPIALVAGVAIVVRWTGWFFPLGIATELRGETALVSLGILGAVIGINVFGAGTVTFDRILGAIVLYILIGVVCSEAYQLISIRVLGAYAVIPHGDSPADRSTWIYFSFVTLTTVGYGDITPVAHAARSLAILEALIGQLYPAIVLARLVSLQVARRGSGTNRS